ncbi:MAG: copper amine oxidase N-terminal domain-containing protein [Defluviitaleaceae bacterium]|nr:copper amine oxidase N-terminal domain-containing protein [Defluviitaleaceae bacterium]
MKKAILAVGAALLMATPAFADTIEILDQNDYSMELNLQNNFLNQRGEVTHYEDEIITITNTNGGTTRILQDEYTFVFGEIEVGVHLAFYYRPDLPVALIYPEQLTAVAIVVYNPEDTLFHKADMFQVQDFNDLGATADANRLISMDGELVINIGPDTEILDNEGNNYEGDLNGRNLLVFYSITTRSIPPQTTPSQIIVLPVEGIFTLTGMMPTLPPINDVESVDLASYDNEEPRDWTGYTIILNSSIGLTNNILEYDDGVYVPLRAVTEALGYTVGWNPATAEVTLTLEDKEVSYLPTTIIRNRAYVPLSFFRELLGFNNAYFAGGHVQINNEEVMQ